MFFNSSNGTTYNTGRYKLSFNILLILIHQLFAINCISLPPVYVSSIYKERGLFSSFSLQIFLSTSFFLRAPNLFFGSATIWERHVPLLKCKLCELFPQWCFQFFYFKFAVKTSFKPRGLSRSRYCTDTIFGCVWVSRLLRHPYNPLVLIDMIMKK
jgi:hypothetical protein